MGQESTACSISQAFPAWLDRLLARSMQLVTLPHRPTIVRMLHHAPCFALRDVGYRLPGLALVFGPPYAPRDSIVVEDDLQITPGKK